MGPAYNEPRFDGAEPIPEIMRATPLLTHADSFPLGGNDHNLLVDLNAILISENTRKHDLGPIADCIHLWRQYHMKARCYPLFLFYFHTRTEQEYKGGGSLRVENRNNSTDSSLTTMQYERTQNSNKHLSCASTALKFSHMLQNTKENFRDDSTSLMAHVQS